MMADNETIALLLYRQLQGTLTTEEQHQLDAWKNSSPDHRYLYDELAAEETLSAALAGHHPDNRTALKARIFQKIRQRQKVTPIRRWIWAAAACALLVIAAGIYLVQQPAPQKVAAQQVISPGRKGAVLTLSNGSQIVLDSLADGLVAQQQGSKARLKGGVLSYDAGDISPGYNTMTTPKGRQFHLVLPDGSQVWLNAASTIRYPTSFTGSQREVEVSGEAYFEIAQDAKRPFRVKTGQQSIVEVLGTAFNINAYADEPGVNITLIAGSIKCNGILLRPGQQSQRSNGIQNIVQANVSLAIAWKNGFFSFQRASLPEVMRQLARWYDVNIIYEGVIPQRAFTGKINRNLSLNEVLEELTGKSIKFKTEGNNVVLMKQIGHQD